MFDLSIVQRIIDIQAERNLRNKLANKEALPVMPSDLVRVHPIVFVRDVLQPCNAKLVKTNWDEDTIYEIEEQHRNLVKEYKYEPSFKTILDQHDLKTKFNYAWEALCIWFMTLHTFCGGFAMLYPKSTSIES